MLTRFDTQRILAQLVRERSELDHQIAELENGPYCTTLCMHCKKVFDPVNDGCRNSDPRAYSPDPVSDSICRECLQRHHQDSL